MTICLGLYCLSSVTAAVFHLSIVQSVITVTDVYIIYIFHVSHLLKILMINRLLFLIFSIMKSIVKLAMTTSSSSNVHCLFIFAATVSVAIGLGIKNL